MEFKDLCYTKPKGTVKKSGKKPGSKSSGKNVQRPDDGISEKTGPGYSDTGDS